ncbi:TRAP-type C4-dicarboxylate transport system, small permease component [Cohaesibacter sp. ES.047]|uniref:TRAP transporter small permease n=1 Tax=Cohaesibacter sp. ES.047 TaxID=1798205 RepID=UPI000BB740FC|nr:TRAP transporter small permease subunit [Cohaesibacter sp. ES.047]SNY92199.1 TRAP-type C4-dicarboxylate transport system, small permease component [Cohaesibacter sp. ES.047]
MMTSLNKALDMVAILFRWLATISLLIMVSINLVNVVVRATLDQAFGWVFPWTLLLFAWMLFFGFYAYVRGKRDVVVDVIMIRLPKPLRILGGLFACTVGMLFMIAILRAAPSLIVIQQTKMDMIDLPLWARSLPLFISSVLVFLHMLLNFIQIATGQVTPFEKVDTLDEPEVQT